MSMKILTFSSLFPNSIQPSHGVFVEHRLRQLVAYAGIESRVVAPVPWFPFGHDMFGEYGKQARVPAAETRHGLSVVHPRYLVIPKIGMDLTPGFMYRAMRPVIRRLLEEFDFDLIDSHFFYPDGVAAVRLGQEFGRPVVITGRGTDLNLYPRYPRPRRQIQWAAHNADGMITVAGALKEYLLEMGVPDEKVRVLRNGVDLQLFQPPADREALRAELGMRAPTLLSVGHLIERKGHHLVIEAMAELPDMHLVLLGDGPEEAALRALTTGLDLEDRVHFAGRVGQEELRRYYGAADALVLASSREGWANVLLESMACGTPVVATPVDGTPEVVRERAGGVLSADRSAPALVAGVRELFANLPARGDTRAYAEGFSWDDTSRGQMELFGEILERRRKA